MWCGISGRSLDIPPDHVRADLCVRPGADHGVTMLETPFPMRYSLIGNWADTEVRPYETFHRSQYSGVVSLGGVTCGTSSVCAPCLRVNGRTRLRRVAGNRIRTTAGSNGYAPLAA